MFVQQIPLVVFFKCLHRTITWRRSKLPAPERMHFSLRFLTNTTIQSFAIVRYVNIWIIACTLGYPIKLKKKKDIFFTVNNINAIQNYSTSLRQIKCYFIISRVQKKCETFLLIT